MSKTKKIMEVLTYQYYDTDPETGKPINMGIKPVFETAGAACADVAVPVTYTIPPHNGMKLNLRIGFDIPEGYNIIMYPRSSLLIKYGIISPVSKIDWDFKLAPVSVPVFNLTDVPVTFEAGTRVAQIELVPMGVEPIDWERKMVARDLNGFGGTGDK